ncbi:MAG: hypothetical protein L3J74_10250 [Bacteroidales bacterium]|nr:hypothetical protein [Bacteroidales bacterium]
MKQIIIYIAFALLIVIFSSPVLFAQKLKRPGYVAKSSNYEFKENKVGMPMKGYYIEKNGNEVEAIIAYSKPEYFVGDFAPAVSLYICKELTDKKVNLFNPDDPNHKEYVEKKDIKAFFIDGHLYANIPAVGWRIVLNEGAIHNFIQVVKMQKADKVFYINFKRTQWFKDEPYGTALGPISTKNLEKMIEKVPFDIEKGADPSEIIAGYRAGKYSLYEAEVMYNIWYDKHNAIQPIDYILGEDGLTKKEGDKLAAEKAEQDRIAAKQKAAEDDLKAQNEANQNATYAPKQDYFAGRTTTVDAAYASAKPEIKVKKEKFKARINRIKNDGNKVAIVVLCSNIEVNPKSHTFFSNQKPQFVRGSYKPIKGIELIGTKSAEQFNKGFGTDVFEFIDLRNIPYKLNGEGKKIDNWWATKYKLIIYLKYNPYYTAYVQTTGDSTQLKKEFKAQMFVKSISYMESAVDGVYKMKTVGKPPKIASYSSEPYLAASSTKVMMIQDLKPLINPWTDEQIVEHLLKTQFGYNTKFIKKFNK